MVKSRRAQIKNSFAENRLFTIRSIVAGIIASVLLLTVAGRLFYLQVLKYDYYSELSQGNRIRTEPIPPSRGLILDRNGLVLADNQPAFNLELVREQVGDAKAVDAALAQLVSIGVLILRFREPDRRRGFRAPGGISVPILSATNLTGLPAAGVEVTAYRALPSRQKGEVVGSPEELVQKLVAKGLI